jgi:hypothetical protein
LGIGKNYFKWIPYAFLNQPDKPLPTPSHIFVASKIKSPEMKRPAAQWRDTIFTTRAKAKIPPQLSREQR